MPQEFDAQRDSWLTIASALDRFGAVFVRRAIDPSVIAALLAVVKGVYADRDARVVDGSLERGLRDIHERFRAIAITDITFAGAPAEATLLTPMVNAVATVLLQKAPAISFSSFRCARASANHLTLPYHQDGRIIAQLSPQTGPDPKMINVWATLEDCDGTRPGLELVDKDVGGLIQAEVSDANPYSRIGAEISPEIVATLARPDQLWRPACKAGDILMFSGAVIHRTYATPDMTAERISIDLRLL